MTQMTTQNQVTTAPIITEDDLWEMFHELHKKVLWWVACNPDIGIIDEFCVATENWKASVIVQFNALYLFAEKYGLINAEGQR